MPSGKPAAARTGRTDWAALRSMPEDEIERAAAQDEDNPTTDEGHWARAAVGLPAHDEAPTKATIQASFDRDVVEFFKRGGRGYQARMNAVLRRYMEAEKERTP